MGRINVTSTIFEGLSGPNVQRVLTRVRLAAPTSLRSAFRYDKRSSFIERVLTKVRFAALTSFDNAVKVNEVNNSRVTGLNTFKNTSTKYIQNNSRNLVSISNCFARGLLVYRSTLLSSARVALERA